MARANGLLGDLGKVTLTDAILIGSFFPKSYFATIVFCPVEYLPFVTIATIKYS